MNLSRDNLQGLKGEAGAPGKNGKDGADGIVGKPVSLTFSSCSHLKILQDSYDWVTLPPFRVFDTSNGLWPSTHSFKEIDYSSYELFLLWGI